MTITRVLDHVCSLCGRKLSSVLGGKSLVHVAADCSRQPDVELYEVTELIYDSAKIGVRCRLNLLFIFMVQAFTQ